MSDSPAETNRSHPLRRVITFWPLVLYGLSVIVGAGIYVALGEVMTRAGTAAPMSFLLAGAAAALTGLCYAALSGRFPEAAGAVAFVRRAFGSDRLAQFVGLAMTAAVAIAAASIANGAVEYLALLLPWPAQAILVVMIGGFTLVACAGVRESVWLAALMGLVEIGGLLAAAANGFMQPRAIGLAAMLPHGAEAWRGVAAGAFIAFFSFVGFEVLANMGEEVKDARRKLPRAIMASVALSVALYIAVTIATVWDGRVHASNPLLAGFHGDERTAFAVAGALAVANGVLVEIVMLSRMFYGMARHGELPATLGAVHPATQTPVRATAAAGALVLAVALLVPFERLLSLANLLTLFIFIMADLALLRVMAAERARGRRDRMPAIVPLAAIVLSLALILAELSL